MVMDYIDFIDSKDIRDINRETLFSPAELALLVITSMHTSVDMKINALNNLISGAHAWNSTGHAPRKQRSTTTKYNIPSKTKAVKWIFSGIGSLCVFICSYSVCIKIFIPILNRLLRLLLPCI